MKIRPSTEGGTSRRPALQPAFRTTTALTAVGQALAGAALAVAVTAGTARAANEWTGTVSSDWFTAGNWADGTVPTAADNAVLGTTTPNFTEIGPGTANAQTLFIGGFIGGGSLVIHSGGDLVNWQSLVGAGGPAAATVTGPGSTWTTTGTLWIGDPGTGILTIANGGAVNSDKAIIAVTGTGAATVTGTGSLWTITDDLVVGRSSGGHGELRIEDGGAVTSVNSTVGKLDGAVGTAIVTGAGSTWSNSGWLFIGEHGTGTLAIENGGAVTSDGVAAVGRDSGGVGTATVAGPGSTWTTNGFLNIGDQPDSEGSLTISNQGTVISNSQVRLANAPGAQGTAVVTGAGSKWAASSQFHVGFEDEGSLTIADGGEVSGATHASIGTWGSGVGTVEVTGGGSVWNNNGDLQVGWIGTGMLSVEHGGAASNTNASIGEEAGSTGGVLVTGPGSTWTNSGYLFVGEHGAGTLTIDNGGSVVADSIAAVGRDSGGVGMATVTGPGSTWTINNFFFIGDLEGSQGSLTIKDGGELVTSSQVRLGEAAGAQGTALVTGAGSKWVSAPDQFHVGFWGEGSLTIADGGEVTGAGYTTIGTWGGGSGMVKVTGAGSAWNNTATGELHVGDRSTGLLIVEEGAAVTGGDGYIGTEADGVGEVSVTGGGSIWANAGNLYVGSLGAGSLTIGSGATVSAGGAVSVADQPGSSGVIVVNGALIGAGGIGVNAGGRLGGGGTVTGNTTVAGTVTPGNSIGTLHIAGDYIQAPGSIYEVEIDAAGNSDLIDVSGTATLNGGTVKVIPFPDFALATPYTILTATGGVTGAFAGLSGGFTSAFLSPQLTYDASSAFLTIAQSASFASAALTPNQESAAAGADSTGSENAVWNAIALLSSADDVPAAFDALSGEVHASAKSALIDESRHVREAMNNRIRSAFEDAGASNGVVAAYGPDGPRLAPDAADRVALWAHAYGAWGSIDGDGNAASLDHSTGGFLIGADAPVGTWRVGALAGYGRSSFEVDDRASSGDSDNYHFGIYGGTKWGRLGLRLGAAYTWHDIETSRSVAFADFSDRLSADYDAATAQAFGELGYRVDTTAAAFEPFANLAYVNLDTDGFTETGGAAALASRDSDTEVTVTTLGLHASRDMNLAVGNFAVRGTLGWRHAFGDTTPVAVNAFAGGSPFVISGVPIAEDAAVVEAGLDLDLGNAATLAVSYSGQLASEAQDHSFRAQLAVRF